MSAVTKPEPESGFRTLWPPSLHIDRYDVITLTTFIWLLQNLASTNLAWKYISGILNNKYGRNTANINVNK